MRRRVVIVGGLVLGGCLFPSLDELGGADAQAVDGAVDSFAPDAPSEGDAQAEPDADADAAPQDSGSDAPSSFCAQHSSAVFCADFDESADAAAGFTTTYLTDGGVVSRDTTEYVTAPAALLAGNAVLASGASAHGAEVAYTNFTPLSSLTLDVDVRVDALATQGSYVEAFALVFDSGAKSSLQLNVKSASSEVGEELDPGDGGAKTYVGHAFPAKLPMGAWSHVTIDVSFAARTLTVTVDAVVVVDHVTLAAGFATGKLDVYVGNAYSPGPSSGASIVYDDVLVVGS